MATSIANQPIPLDQWQSTWEMLADRLDAFLEGWSAGGTPPDLERFLPDADNPRRRLILVELIKADLEHRLKCDANSTRVEHYIARFPELSSGGIPVDLLFEEYHLRKQAGHPVELIEYRFRFPNEIQSLARLVGSGTGFAATLSDQRQCDLTVNVGESLDEFRVLREIGHGAFAKVYLAWQQSMQRTVALKVSSDQGAEPQTLAQLDHPNIVRVFDQRVFPDRRMRLMYMSYLPGGTLADVVEKIKERPRDQWNGAAYLEIIDANAHANGVEPPSDSATRSRLAAMSWPQVVGWIGSRLAGALAYAHSRNVLHRDVKPANVLLTNHGEPQLADFNIGQASFREPGPAALFGGSLPYMAPEHLEAFHPQRIRPISDVDHRSDAYALGMLLWELLAGERPFVGETFCEDRAATLAALVENRRGGVPESSRAKVSQHPKAMIDCLARSLAGDPHQRYQSARDMAQALDLCLHPETQALLEPADSGWRAWFRRHAAIGTLTVGVAPSLVLSIFNIQYNQAAVMDARPGSQGLFQILMVVINGVFFPVGAAVFLAYAWPIQRILRQVDGNNIVSDDVARATRRRCYRLSNVGSAVIIASWCAAGITWPIAMDIWGGMLSPDAHLHFLASLTLCGLLAAVFPFFLLSHVSIRALLPPLLRDFHLPPEEIQEIDRLGRSLRRNWLLAAAVPLVGIAALVFFDSQDRTTMKILTAFGLAGSGFAYFWEMKIRRDLVALELTYRL